MAQPTLTRASCGGLGWWTDTALAGASVVFAFTERTGGVSEGPYESLNLAAHVGDVADCVDINRARVLDALGLSQHAGRLTVAEQVHGARVLEVVEGGVGARAQDAPVPGTDAMVTSVPGIPLLMCFADCVPIVLVAPGPVVAVVHAGWRGALAGIASEAVGELASISAMDPEGFSAYIGPHIGSCHYEVSPEILSQFVESFGTVARAESGGLDLGAVVAADLIDAGVLSCRTAALGRCTAEETDRFFSHRAESGLTGRHGAIVCILP